MNTSKLSRIIENILLSEKEFDYQLEFTNILGFVEQNNPEDVKLSFDKIMENFVKTSMSNYVSTELKTLEETGALGYFDPSMINSIQNILSSPGYETIQKMHNFIDQRAKLLEQFKKLQSSLLDLGIRAESSLTSDYAIAFALPEKYHALDTFQKAIRDFDLFLNSLTFSLSDENKNYKISSVDNGCIELFINALPEMAARVVGALDTILKIKGAIDLWTQSKKIFSRYSKKNKDATEKIAKSELEDEKMKQIEEYIDGLNLKGETTDLNDAKNRVRGLLCVVVKYFEDGVTIEVKTPLIQAPRKETAEDSKDVKADLAEKRKLYENKVKIDGINKRIYQLQQEKVRLDLPESIYCEKENDKNSKT